MRLQKFLAEAGIASRRQAEKIIEQGRVRVNGARPKLGDTVDPERDDVRLDGRPVAPREKVYILLNKPRGVITSVDDPQERKTVIDCIKGFPQRIFPVGRLDQDVTGALLLTNDGELAQRMTHPKHGMKKVYEARVRGVMRPQTAARMKKGVRLEDGMARAEVEIIETAKNSSLIRLTLREGRNRLVKRLCEEVGHKVRELHRVSTGGLGVERLAPAEWRFLTEKEVTALKKLAKLAD